MITVVQGYSKHFVKVSERLWFKIAYWKQAA